MHCLAAGFPFPAPEEYVKCQNINCGKAEGKDDNITEAQVGI
jgi:hypothetical protein